MKYKGVGHINSINEVAEPLNAKGLTVNHQCDWNTNGDGQYSNAVSRPAAECYV
eukprot:CAMPEP_0206237512 /NCGR_PEP_ID=MMETSP0047_2-20121206/14309_1 /ASSEMBLY_ACC=CAM_ASM_000192 /TAXON_ID=195065 /ORGANISM="Chroomonas mesostigmatica_cf, Strain CCMP1168" /LENGTH=53 /DNA_ID=CAMNT_0053661961 /DNA_START=141 /DNA_END=302 /DNA_ORIENTATION=+